MLRSDGLPPSNTYGERSAPITRELPQRNDCRESVRAHKFLSETRAVLFSRVFNNVFGVTP